MSINDDGSDTRIGNDIELSPTPSHNRTQSLSRHAAMALGLSPNVHGMKLGQSSDFWLLFTLLSMRAFTCLSSTFFHL